ncbi:MAG: VOC family protein [Gemmatimonadales bacterium]
MAKRPPVISVMVAVPDAPLAVAWYQRALGAVELWNLGSVVGLEIAGAPFFVGEPANNRWETPAKLGMPSARIEVFCDDPDAFIARAVEAGANGSVDKIRNHEMPWGPHRQGGFLDPFGHMWLVGDRSPLSPHSGS